MTRKWWVVSAAIMVAAAAALFLMGRNPICTCGEIKLWVGEVHGPDNSQHIADWYTPSHIIHGFVFFGLLWWWMRERPLGLRFAIAAAVEAGWEVLENSPIIINRYREATMAFGYTGDSILNSLCDVGWMMLGFLAARRLGLWPTVAIAVFFELLTLWIIRDNLTLNVVMLVWPVDAIREWQAAL